MSSMRPFAFSSGIVAIAIAVLSSSATPQSNKPGNPAEKADTRHFANYDSPLIEWSVRTIESAGKKSLPFVVANAQPIENHLFWKVDGGAETMPLTQRAGTWDKLEGRWDGETILEDKYGKFTYCESYHIEAARLGTTIGVLSISAAFVRSNMSHAWRYDEYSGTDVPRDWPLWVISESVHQWMGHGPKLEERSQELADVVRVTAQFADHVEIHYLSRQRLHVAPNPLVDVANRQTFLKSRAHVELRFDPQAASPLQARAQYASPKLPAWYRDNCVRWPHESAALANEPYGPEDTPAIFLKAPEGPALILDTRRREIATPYVFRLFDPATLTTKNGIMSRPLPRTLEAMTASGEPRFFLEETPVTIGSSFFENSSKKNAALVYRSPFDGKETPLADSNAAQLGFKDVVDVIECIERQAFAAAKPSIDGTPFGAPPLSGKPRLLQRDRVESTVTAQKGN